MYIYIAQSRFGSVVTGHPKAIKIRCLAVAAWRDYNHWELVPWSASFAGVVTTLIHGPRWLQQWTKRRHGTQTGKPTLVRLRATYNVIPGLDTDKSSTRVSNLISVRASIVRDASVLQVWPSCFWASELLAFGIWHLSFMSSFPRSATVDSSARPTICIN